MLLYALSLPVGHLRGRILDKTNALDKIEQALVVSFLWRYYSAIGAGHLTLRLITKSAEPNSADRGLQVPGT